MDRFRIKKIYIQTMGCQMNVYDSEQILKQMTKAGYEPAGSPEEADLVICNTCSIREKAEQKAFSFLGRLAALKQKRPELIIGMGGCVAQQEGRQVLRRLPHVDLVFGTQAISRLPAMVASAASRRQRLVDTRLEHSIGPDEFLTNPVRLPGVTAFVTIMRGCDNFCSYCVVPYVRGRETSRHPDEIVSEIEKLVARGVREVTLLGQNVNSYGKKEGLCSFSRLLEKINAISGLERIRFTTSHPKDLSRDLMEAFIKLDKLCNHIHLPVQSGSDAVLKRMNRKYSRSVYTEKIRALRAICPDVAITSDIIVGFPGETEEDFRQTLDLIAEIGFDGLFAFMYSDRPNAPAACFEAKVDEQEKKRRLQEVLSLQAKYTEASNRALMGTVQQVLVEGPGDDSAGGECGRKLSWKGRTATNKIVHFGISEKEKGSNQMLTGRVMDIMIKRALPHCLLGEPFAGKRGVPSNEAKGAINHASQG